MGELERSALGHLLSSDKQLFKGSAETRAKSTKRLAKLDQECLYFFCPLLNVIRWCTHIMAVTRGLPVLPRRESGLMLQSRPEPDSALTEMDGHRHRPTY